MKRALICEADSSERIKLRNAIERYAADKHIANVETIVAQSPSSLKELVEGARDDFYDFVVCRIQEEGARAAIDAIREVNPEMCVILTSSSSGDAMIAYELKARFFLVPGKIEDFNATVGAALDAAAASRVDVVALKSANGVDNILLDDVLFAESAKKGPIIHLPGDGSIVVRGTLSSLYDRLVEADPERFSKVGGSFIVNLDNVRSMGKGSIIFPDGEAIIMPIRSRKTFKDALDAYRSS